MANADLMAAVEGRETAALRHHYRPIPSSPPTSRARRPPFPDRAKPATSVRVKIAVTGAAGFVGAALCQRLVASGQQVHALVRPGSRPAARSALEATVMEADLADPNSLHDAFAGCDVVMHCAGESARHAAPEVLSWLNVAGTENAIAAARHARVARFVHLSCADVSLVNRDRVHWKETAVLGQAPLGAYARTKLLAEELALQASDRKLAVVALRPAYLWGPAEHTNLPELCRQARLGSVQLFGRGDNLLSTAHIDNVVAALIAAATSERVVAKALHVADPDFQTAREFFTQLCGALGLPAPRGGVYALAYARAWLRMRRQQPGPWPDDVARVGRGGMLDCLRALTELELTPPISVADGMAALATWAHAAGGPSAIEALARKPAGHDELARWQRLADSAAA